MRYPPSIIIIISIIFLLVFSVLPHNILAPDPTPVWPTVWTTPPCNTDPSDESPSQIDIIGDGSNPAVYYATDANFLYFRERVEGDPNGPPGKFTQDSWVVVDEQTGDNYYDFLFSINGKDELVQILKNTVQAAQIDWSPIFNDPAETTIWSGSTATYARIDSDGTGYWFVSWAVPRSYGEFTIGLNPTFYFSTSADANNYNKDHLNCYEAPYCGDGIVNSPEVCELPNTFDNTYCSQTTQECSGPKQGTRDSYGNCDSICGCIFDSFVYQCVLGQCGATCDSNDDCSNKCVGEVRYYDGTCDLASTCSCSWSTQNCDDGNECTYDYCDSNSGCSNPAKPSGTECGSARDCPSDACNFFKAEFYPDDGHDTCDGSGSCLVYSCVLENSYCTDNDANDGVDSLTCGAECDQNSDCQDTDCDYLDGCVGKDYHDYSDVSNTCLGDCSCTDNQCGSPTIYPNDARCYVCGDGILDGNEQCDPGADVSGDCCDANCMFETNGFTCRASTGVCDIAEQCTGLSAECPSDLKSTDLCRASAGDCDVAEYCDGINNDCPVDAFQPDTYLCRVSAGECDIDDYCSGSSTECPTDAKSTAECRPAAGICDVAEYCDGFNNYCPVDLFLPSSLICRPSAGECDIAELCTGSSADCPVDEFKILSTPCDKDNSVCTIDHCDGFGSCVLLNDLDCSDGNECTQDLCDPQAGCSNPPETQGTECGSARDCPSDACNLFKAEFYPDDGHDTCDGFGICVVYSCALENSYCTDNDANDGVDSLICGAECDQDSDCAQSTEMCDYINRKYCTRDGYGTCNGDCNCVEDVWNCGQLDDAAYCSHCNHCGDGIVNCGEQCEQGQPSTKRCLPPGTTVYYCINTTSYQTPEFDSCRDTCVWDNCTTKIIKVNDTRCQPLKPPTCSQLKCWLKSLFYPCGSLGTCFPGITTTTTVPKTTTTISSFSIPKTYFNFSMFFRR